MSRPVWSGALTFGLVTLPVALYRATQDRTVRFHQLQSGTGDRVRNRRVNERTGKKVPFDQVVKGYAVGAGEYVVIEPEQLEQIAPERSRAIDISGFIALDDVDPVFFDRTYYLGPRGEEYAKTYRVLAQALERADRAGLALFSMRGREHLVVVRGHDGLLELHTLHFADEVLDPRQEIGSLPSSRTRVSNEELDAARLVIETLSVDWKPEEWHDRHQDRVRKLIQEKAQGREIAAAVPQDATKAVDLLDVLHRSLNSAHGRRDGAAAAGGRSGGSHARQANASRSHASSEQLSQMSKAQLYHEAVVLQLPGRSTMERDELEAALRKARRRGKRRLGA